MSRDLAALLASVDLEALADELLGGHRGTGRSAVWPSPVPGHPQTGKSPPMSIFTDRRGVQRWTCWATGTSGTAIDLVAVARGLDVADAIRWLEQRHGRFDPPAPPRRARTPPPRVGPSAELLGYVAACRQRLWDPEGAAALRWLHVTRRLSTAVLHANQIGFDPGPQRLWRPSGLPRQGAGIVIPTFDRAGTVVYAQTRYRRGVAAASGRKYDNPSARHGTKPRLSWPCDDLTTAVSAPTLVCEGVIDAMTVIGAGYQAVALLAAGDASSAAAELAVIDGPLVLAVDNDAAGAAAVCALVATLTAAGHTSVATLRVPADLNELAQRCGQTFPAVLRAVVRGCRPATPERSGPVCGR